MSGKEIDATPVIGDFGFAVHLEEGETCTKRVGSKGYTAPEVLLGEPYAFEADIFSLGCLFYALVTADLPFLADTMEDYFFRSQYETVKFDHEEWDDIHDDLKELITMMLDKKPSERPKIEQVLKHPWFNI